jgi:hypothetical protein
VRVQRRKLLFASISPPHGLFTTSVSSGHACLSRRGTREWHQFKHSLNEIGLFLRAIERPKDPSTQTNPTSKSPKRGKGPALTWHSSISISHGLGICRSASLRCRHSSACLPSVGWVLGYLGIWVFGWHVPLALSLRKKLTLTPFGAHVLR